MGKIKPTIDNSPVTFGKYRGKTPNQILFENPSYIKWMYLNFKSPPCTKELYESSIKKLTYRYNDNIGPIDEWLGESDLGCYY